MASAAELVLLLKASPEGLSSGMGEAKGMVGGLVDSLGKLGLAGMGIGVVTGAVEGVIGSLGGLVGAAEGVGDAAARVGLVWGAEMQGVIADNATVANSLGLTKAAYLDQVGALGQLATSLGVGGDAAADMAMGITELAPKLAAYAGAEGQVASDALEKALLGKTKGLAALGIAITEADKAQAAMALGIGGEASKWTEAEVAQVNYQAILAKTGAAQAAWADNQGDVEVSMRRVSAAMDDAKAAIGEKLLPVLAPLAEQFANVLPGAIDSVMGVLGPLFDRLGSIDFSGVTAAFADVGAALSSLGQGDSGGFIDGILSAFTSLTGVDVSGWVQPISDAFAFLKDTAAAVMDVIGPWLPTFTELIGIVAGLATGLAAFSIISTVIGWITSAIAIFGGMSAAITTAGGIVAAIVAVLGGPLTIAIGLVAGVIALFTAAWANNWGDIQGKVAEVVAWYQENVAPIISQGIEGIKLALADLVSRWNDAWNNQIKPAINSFMEWWSANVAPIISATVATIGSILGGIVTFFRENWDSIMQIVSGAMTIIQGYIDIGWAVIKGIFNTALALLKGDWEGAWNSLKKTVSDVWEGVKKVLGGFGTSISGVVTIVKTEAGKIGTAIVDGIKNALTSTWDGLVSKLRGLVNLLPQAVRDLLGIASPSKIFEQIGQWITIGLASGIQKADQKAIEALANVVSKITSVATGLADFGKRLADMVSPTDAQIASAKEKYIRMTLVLTDFIKSISYLGSLLPVSSMGQAGPGQIKAINAGLTQLSQAFPAIKELQGLGAENLLTGGEADWAGKLSDMVGKIAGVWGGLADNMGKMASAKFPSDSQLQALKESTIRIALWAADSLKNPTLPSVGAAEFAASMKSITDALSTVAGLNLSGIVVVADRELQTAGASLTSLATWAKAMIEDWLVIMPDQKARAEFVGQLQEFAGLIKSAADIVKSADIGDLSKMVVLQVSDFGPVKDSLGRMQQVTTEIVQAWAKGAGDAAARAQWITDLKDFAATMGAAADILKISAIGEIDATLTVNIDAVRSVLTSIRDDLGPAIQELADEWARVNTEGEKATARMALFGGWIKAALDIAKASVVGELEANILVNKDIMLRILVWLRDDFAPAIQGISDAWVMAEKQAAEATEKMKTFSSWLGAAVDIAKASVIGELHANVLVNGETMKAILVWLRDDFVPAIQEIADGWSMSDKAGGEAAARMKAFADWVRAATDIAKSTVVGELHANILVNTEVMKAILVWLRDSFVPAIQEIADGWGETAKSAAPIVEKMNAFASVIKAATDIAKASDIGDLAGATSTSDLAGKLQIVKANVLAVYGVLGEIAQDITASEAEYRARIASALGGIGKSFGDFGGGVGGIMELVESRLFGGADPTRGDLGFSQRTKGNRANFNASVLTDTIKRVVSAISDAMKGMSLPDPDDPKIKAISALSDAFSKLAGALTDLSTAKLPDARRIAAVLAATAALSAGAPLSGGPGGTGGGAPGSGSGGKGSPITGASGDTINLYGNFVVVTETDDPKGLVEALKLALI